VKWAFEEGLEESMRKVGDEKATLAIILEAFTA
jgi:hypothetical protein